MWTPLFGLYLARAGLIAVDRRGGARALKRMVAAARKAARLGRPIVIFPEGTRVAPAQPRPFPPGVAALAGHLGRPLLPVATHSGLFWRRLHLLTPPPTILPALRPPPHPRHTP